MKDENKHDGMGKGSKIIIIIMVVVVMLWMLGRILLSMIPTVGGSFGYGFPSGSGGRAIRDVEIDVDPQVVYRIDDHRFFTLEKYKDCSSGGFVYYNDTHKEIKIFAGNKGYDKKPQNEVSISQENNIMAFKGDFIYAANDNVIAYPSRNVNYKYGDSTYFIVYKNIQEPSKKSRTKSISMDSIAVVTDDAIYMRGSILEKNYEKYNIPINSDRYELTDPSEINFNKRSQDDHFHCDNSIRPRKMKYISN